MPKYKNNNACSPNIDIDSHYTCFTMDELIEIANAFNHYIKVNNICSDDNGCVPKKQINIKNKSKKQLWNSIYNRLNKICKYEWCWVDQKFIEKIPDTYLQEKLQYFTFKPKMNHNEYNWLSTSDINNVMQQYQEFDKSFKFLGALPCDFYKLTKVKYNDIPKYKKIGIIFNLDTHDKSGSHWVSFLIDNTKRTIEYFDSTGSSPNIHIKQFIKFLKREILHDYNYLQNKYVHQKKNSECGVYSIYYIIQRLLGNDFHSITSNIITDNQMNVFRRYIFRI